MISKRGLAQFDYLMFFAAVLLALCGSLGIYSAGLHSGGQGFFYRQLVWIAFGGLVCVAVAALDYHRLIEGSYLIYGAAILMLIGILLFGVEVNGSKSWISVGGVHLQPSEMTKLVVILVLARYLGELQQNFLGRNHLMALSGIVMAPVVLIVLQRDLGTAVMFLPILFGVLIVAGLRMRFLAVSLALVLCLAPLGWAFLKDYQKERIMTTLNPSLDPYGVGYQTRQSVIAIGSGGIFGKGLGKGLQSQLGYVPEVHTDFIFALLTEENGFVTACIILLLYLLVLVRLIRIAEKARDRVGILVVTGVACLIFSHVVVNVGMTLGLLPPIGIPLPLLSYGGSSTLTTFAALGLALSVHSHRFVYS